jgi:hypothetical protein
MMPTITIKLDNVKDVAKFYQKKKAEIRAGAERVEERNAPRTLALIRSKIHNITKETRSSYNVGKVYKTNASVSIVVGTMGGTKNDAIRALSLEYGHAAPKRGKDSKFKKPSKDVPAHPHVRPAVDETKKPFVSDMRQELNKICDKE